MQSTIPDTLGDLSNVRGASSAELETRLDALAVLARTPSGRALFAEKQALVQEIVDLLDNDEVSSGVKAECLRVLVNMCADDNTNRMLLFRILGSIHKDVLERRIRDEDTCRNGVILAYNLTDNAEWCNALVKSGFGGVLVNHLATRHDSDTLGYMMETLAAMLTSDTATGDDFPDNTLRVIITSLDTDPSLCLALADALLAVLCFPKFQHIALENDARELYRLCRLYESGVTYLETPGYDKDKEEDEEKNIRTLDLLLYRIDSFTSMVPEFNDIVLQYIATSEVIALWISWIAQLGTRGSRRLATAGVVLVGNVCLTASACKYMVKERKVQAYLTATRISPLRADTEFYTSALGLLRHLAVESLNKRVVALDGAMQVVESVLTGSGADDMRVVVAALQLLRVLVTQCYENAVAVMTGSSAGGDEMSISACCMRYADATTPLAIRIEATRVLSALLCTLCTPGAGSDSLAFFSDPDHRKRWCGGLASVAARVAAALMSSGGEFPADGDATPAHAMRIAGLRALVLACGMDSEGAVVQHMLVQMGLCAWLEGIEGEEVEDGGDGDHGGRMRAEMHNARALFTRLRDGAGTTA
ncbi:uncharacterized protein V1518DRAFT_414653 [Limtongia smithiae]|uniref:uncharacterized protein n=1 Tax=Limtongia smithiae TaxID=1125753 RepID=UPI0034CEC3FA